MLGFVEKATNSITSIVWNSVSLLFYFILKMIMNNQTRIIHTDQSLNKDAVIS